MDKDESPVNPLPVVLSPINIEIIAQPGKRYKSIDSLEWRNVPALAIVTGPNGTGKTQLLELLAYKLSNTVPPGNTMDGIEVRITGDSFSPGSVVYLPSKWELTPRVSLNVVAIQQAKANAFDEIVRAKATNDIKQSSRIERIRDIAGKAGEGFRNREEFYSKLPDDYSFMMDDGDVVAGLAFIMIAHRLRVAEQLEKNQSREAIVNILGPAPWDLINESLRAAEFPYQIVPPTRTPIAGEYKLEFESQISGECIQPGDLSSGEKMILTLVLWLYKSRHHGVFPRLLVLDEPDAHLHPSLARQFLNVLRDVLVGRYGVRVILTTHSPSTVALSPPDSVFEMSRNAPRIQRSSSTEETIGMLTAGLVVVSASSRFVLVEDDSDVSFYEMIRDILSDYGPSRDPRAIRPAPSVIFLPASRGNGPSKIGGGSSVVTSWVEKLNQPPLSEIIRGVIDGDGKDQSIPRVCMLKRYSIENYLLDPIVVFCLLLSCGKSPPVAGLKVSAGDEHLIREEPELMLSSIVDSIACRIESHLPNYSALDSIPRTVEFTNKKSIKYPGWIFDRKGHELLPIFQTALGGAKLINPPRLEQAYRRLRLVPNELADIFVTLQS